LVCPLVTQGPIADFSAETLAFEAGSASGSSGGPVFDRAGRVIAVNHAVLRRADGLNVGLRVEPIYELAARLGLALEPLRGAPARGRT
jgi:S1-C subfamily serine protease